MKKIWAIVALILFLGVLSYSYASEFRSLYNSVFSIESERIVVSPWDAVVFSFSKQISTIDFNLTSGFTIKTLEWWIWSDIWNTVDQFPPLRWYLVRNFSLNDLVITATYANVTSISQSIFQKSLKAWWNLVWVAYKDDVNWNISVANWLWAALPYSQVLDFTWNGFSSWSSYLWSFTWVTNYYSWEIPLSKKVYYSWEMSIFKNVTNIVSNSGYTITSKASMAWLNLNEGLAYGIFVNNDTLMSWSQKLTSAENIPYYTPPKVWVIPDVWVYSWSNSNILYLPQYFTPTDWDPILSNTMSWSIPVWLSFSWGILSWNTTQTWTYVLWFSATDKDWVSNVRNFNLIVSDTASLLDGQNITIDLLWSLLLRNYPSGSLIAANKLAADWIINDNSAIPSNYKLWTLILKKEVAKISVNVAGLIPSTTCSNIFSDVSATTPNTWACGYTEALVNAWLYSTGSLKFYPESYVSKAETLRLALESAGYTWTYTNPNNWQAEVVAFAVAKWVTTNFTDYNSPITKWWAYSMFSDARDAMNTGTNLLGQLLGGGWGTGSTNTWTTSTWITLAYWVSLSNNTPAIGEYIDLTISAVDSNGNIVPTYTWSIIVFSQTDVNATFTGLLSTNEYKFNVGDKWIKTFIKSVKFSTWGLNDIMAYDLNNSLIAWFSNIIVSTGSTNTWTITWSWTPPVVSNVNDIIMNSWILYEHGLSYKVTSTNWDPILSYSLTGILPIWLSFNTWTAIISWTPIQNWTYLLWLSATDKDWISNIINFNLIVWNWPVIWTILDQIYTPWIPVIIDFSKYVTAISWDPITSYNLWNQNLYNTIPNFDTKTWILTWSLNLMWTWLYQFDTLSTKWFLSSSIFRFVKKWAITPPLVWTITNQTYLSWATVNLDLSTNVTVNTNAISTYNLIWTLPTWLSFNTASWVISWTVTQTWTYSMWISVTNSGWTSNVSNFNIMVNDLPIIWIIPTQTGSINFNMLGLSKYVTSSGWYIYSYNLTWTLPSWLIFNTLYWYISSTSLTIPTSNIWTYALWLSVTDNIWTSNTSNFNLVIWNWPTVSPIPDQPYNVWVPINIDFSKYVTPQSLDPINMYSLEIMSNNTNFLKYIKTGINNEIFTYSWWLIFNSKTWILSWSLKGWYYFLWISSTSKKWFNSSTRIPILYNNINIPVVWTIANQTYLSWAVVNLDLSTNVTSTWWASVTSYTLTW